MIRALAVIAAFALLVYALADFANSDERERGGIPRWLWVVLIVVLPFFGPLSWIVFARTRRADGGAQGAPSPYRTGPAAPRRRPGQPVAPDDDPDFLWRLAREQRNQARKDAAEAAPEATDPADPDSSSGADDDPRGEPSR